MDYGIRGGFRLLTAEPSGFGLNGVYDLNATRSELERKYADLKSGFW